MVTYKISRELVDMWLSDYKAIIKKNICIEAGVMKTLFHKNETFSYKTANKLRPVIIKYGYLIWYEKLQRKDLYEGCVFQLE